VHENDRIWPSFVYHSQQLSQQGWQIMRRQRNFGTTQQLMKCKLLSPKNVYSVGLALKITTTWYYHEYYDSWGCRFRKYKCFFKLLTILNLFVKSYNLFKLWIHFMISLHAFCPSTNYLLKWITDTTMEKFWKLVQAIFWQHFDSRFNVWPTLTSSLY
jgi:hypothetical protein